MFFCVVITDSTVILSLFGFDMALGSLLARTLPKLGQGLEILFSFEINVMPLNGRRY
jgi:hypothetical protein